MLDPVMLITALCDDRYKHNTSLSNTIQAYSNPQGRRRSQEGGLLEIEESPMTYQMSKAPPPASKMTSRPLVTSYDTGDEHSLEHYVYVQRLVEEDDDVSPELFATFASTGLAPDHGVAVL
jgi:hypothetical protein